MWENAFSFLSDVEYRLYRYVYPVNVIVVDDVSDKEDE